MMYSLAQRGETRKLCCAHVQNLEIQRCRRRGALDMWQHLEVLTSPNFCFALDP